MIPQGLVQAIVLLAGAIAGAFGLFQWLGKRWLESVFAKQLERFRHQQAEELERLRFRISTVLDRTTKLHQHEFEVLPELWQRLVDAYSEVQVFVSRLQTYQDLALLSADRLEEFLDESSLRASEKADIRAAPDKNKRYQEAIFWHRLGRVKRSYSHFHTYLIAQGVFIQPDLKRQFHQLSDIIFAAMVERELEQAHPSLREGRFADCDKLRSDGPKLLDALEDRVRGRLWDTALDPVAPAPTAN